MGYGFDDVMDAASDIKDSFSDLAEDLWSGDIAEIASSTTGLLGDIMENAAPFVGLFNPAAGAALNIGGSVFDAIKDGKISVGEVFDIGQTVLESVGLGAAVGSGLETMAGVNAVAERYVLGLLEKQINGEGITQEDVDVLRDLIQLLNNENMKRAERSGKKGKGNASAGGEGAGGSEGAGGAEGAGGSEGASGSIFELIATVFGEKMKKALGNMRELADKIEDAEDDDVAKFTPQFTAAAQEFSFLSQGFNTGINALGQGLNSAARKQ